MSLYFACAGGEFPTSSILMHMLGKEESVTTGTWTRQTGRIMFRQAHCTYKSGCGIGGYHDTEANRVDEKSELKIKLRLAI